MVFFSFIFLLLDSRVNGKLRAKLIKAVKRE